MKRLTGLLIPGGDIQWQYLGDDPLRHEEGLALNFLVGNNISKDAALRILQKSLKHDKPELLSFKGGNWILKLDSIRDFIKELHDIEWFEGNVAVEPEIEHEQEEVFGKLEYKTYVRFIATKGDMVQSRSKRIFLSHKGVDKSFVREFKDTLKLLGFTTWLDEDAMVAGDELDRALLQGFKDSCAAIFFITPSFKDENFLKMEINYAIAEKRAKKEKFAVIPLVFQKDGKKGKVPDLLKQYVQKEPKNQLQAIIEIIRALPIEVGDIRWKDL